MSDEGNKAITVGDLIKELSEVDPLLPVHVSFDSGYGGGNVYGVEGVIETTDGLECCLVAD